MGTHGIATVPGTLAFNVESPRSRNLSLPPPAQGQAGGLASGPGEPEQTAPYKYPRLVEFADTLAEAGERQDQVRRAEGPMSRLRILLVPSLTEIEWAIRPLIEEWADVASFDAAGVGEEPPPEDGFLEASARRGLAELDGRGWERCVIVGDEYGAGVAARIAAARPEAVDALVL